MLRRRHLFELEDQTWFPALIRDAGSAYLEFMARFAGHGKAVAPLLFRALHRAHENRIIDLCSGGSGPLPTALAEILDRHDQAVAATLTDFYPNREAFERTTREHPMIDAIHEPVDAVRVPADLEGLRTIFSGFHHFRPAQAKRILENAAEDRAPIAIFEIVARHPLALFGMFFAPLMTLLLMPFLRPFRWGWVPLTYVVPVIPFFIFWDGFVSCLRCYSLNELREMTQNLESSDYDWEIGGFDLPGVPFDGSYLIGVPTTRSRTDESAPAPATE